MNKDNLHLETILAHLSDFGDVRDIYGASHMPIYQTATFDLKKQGENPYDYTRSGNPTRESLENSLAKVCGGKGVILTHTGIGAVALLFESILNYGDSILIDRDTYGGTFRLLKNYRERMAVNLVFTDLTNHLEVEKLLKNGNIKMILMESPTNPGLKIIDIKEIGQLSKKYGTILAVDNSLATFASQKPLEL
ncbi:MAG: PLP-dependent transferase, partial [Spirochaetales bacterium]|nr:PLP-dependent transferase [Spirochaetales bacterium]